MTHVTHIDHIAIATDSLEKSLAFFEHTLGLQVSSIEELPERGIKVAMIPLGQSRIELIEPLHEQSEITGFLQKRGPGLHHIALCTSDIKEDIKQLNDAGKPPLHPTPKPGAHNTQVTFIHPKSTHGVLVELVEH